MSKLQFVAYPAVAALALASAVSAQAAGGAEGADYDFASARAAVTAPAPAAAQASAAVVTVRSTRLAQPVDMYGYDYNPYADFKSTKTRAEVRAEVLAVPRDNRLAAVYGEDIGNFYYAAVEQTEHRLAPRAGKSAFGQ